MMSGLVLMNEALDERIDIDDDVPVTHLMTDKITESVLKPASVKMMMTVMKCLRNLFLML